MTKYTNKIVITIDTSNCDFEKKISFTNSINEKKLNEIRSILGEPTATIIYSKMKDGFVKIVSVVQRKEDFKND